MNYKNIYIRFIDNLKGQVPKGYYESHHIIPKAIGGSNDKSNIIKLTARQHLFAHRLLAKIHGGSMWLPVVLMSNRAKLSSHAYEYARKQHSEFMKSHNPMDIPEYRHKISTANKLRGQWVGDSNPSRINHPKGMLGKSHSKETKIIMSNGKANTPRPNFEYEWVTPSGKFNTRLDAAKVENIPPCTVRYRCFSTIDKWKNWYVIPKFPV